MLLARWYFYGQSSCASGYLAGERRGRAGEPPWQSAAGSHTQKDLWPAPCKPGDLPSLSGPRSPAAAGGDQTLLAMLWGAPGEVKEKVERAQ